MLTPTCWHGVTTIVMGNCGVGFAPVQPDKHDVAHRADGRRRGHPGRRAVRGHRVGVGALPRVPRRGRPPAEDARRRRAGSARRGARLRDGGARREERARHRRTTSRRWRASCAKASRPARSASRRAARSRTWRSTVSPCPERSPRDDELFGIGRVLGELGTGVFELAPAGALGEDLAAPEREMAWMRKLSAAIGRPVTFALTQNDHDPESWTLMLELCAQAAAEGAQVTPAGRGPAREPAARPADVPPVRVLPVVGADRCRVARGEGRGDARSRAAREAARRGRRRDRADAPVPRPRARVPDGRPPRLRAVARATASPASPARRAAARWKCSTTSLLDDDGLGLVMRPLLNYTDFSLDAVREMLAAPEQRVGPRRRRRALRHHLRREHAHVHARALGPRPCARPPAARVVVKKMTADTASLYGLGDRGVLAAGHGRRRERDRLRRAAARRCRRWCTTCPATPAASCTGSTGYLATVKSRHGDPLRRRRPGRAPRSAAPRRALTRRPVRARASRSSARGSRRADVERHRRCRPASCRAPGSARPAAADRRRAAGPAPSRAAAR